MARRSSVSFRARVLVLGLVAALGVTSEGVASAVPPPAPVAAVAAPADPVLTPQDVAPLSTARAEPDSASPGVVWGEFSNDPTRDGVPVAPPAEQLPAETRELSGFKAGVSQVVDRTEHADVYANPDGTHTVRNSATQINAADASGKIVPIDAKLRAAAADLDTPVTRGALGTVAARQVPAFTT